MPADALVATVERFNGFAATGVDEDFGRGEDEYDTFFAGGDGPNKALTPSTRRRTSPRASCSPTSAPRAAWSPTPAGRVLREDGGPIPGLYAAEQLRGLGLRAAYPGPGAPLGTAMVFASLAVRGPAALPARLPGRLRDQKS